MRNVTNSLYDVFIHSAIVLLASFDFFVFLTTVSGEALNVENT